MGIRLLALDIDGTLTNTTRDVSRANLEAIARAQEAGVFVTIATGRGYLSSSPIWKLISVRGPVINYGGAIVIDTRSDALLHFEGLASETVRDAMRFAREIGVHAQLYQGDEVICAQRDAFAEGYCARHQLPLTIDPELYDKSFENVPKVLAYAPGESEEPVRLSFAEHMGKRAGVSKTSPGFIEINSPSASKGRALALVAERLGIPRKEVAAIGDSYLDMDMIEWAGDGVCVADGLDVVKAVSDTIIPACGDDGVAWYIDHVVLQ